MPIPLPFPRPFSQDKEKEQRSEPSIIYQYLVRNNHDVAEKLHKNKTHLEDWAYATDVDPDLIRAIILHESRGWGSIPFGEDTETALSHFRSGEEGSYGFAQLSSQPRAKAGISIAQARKVEGAIRGAAIWLQDATNELKAGGVKHPTAEQIAAQYNSDKQRGSVGSYGRDVGWTLKQIKSGNLGHFHDRLDYGKAYREKYQAP